MTCRCIVCKLDTFLVLGEFKAITQVKVETRHEQPIHRSERGRNARTALNVLSTSARRYPPYRVMNALGGKRTFEVGVEFLSIDTRSAFKSGSRK